MARGRRALLRSVALGVVFAAGAGLVLASALLALSAWIGPIAATGVSGAVLLLAGGLFAIVTRRRPDRAAQAAPLPVAEDLSNAGLVLPGLGLVLGLALSTLLFRKTR